MISIIIVGYNSKKYLSGCLDSIFNSSYNKFRVIFIDNDSSDDSVDFVKRNYPRVDVLISQKNIGFAGANNLGIKHAQELGTDYIFLLNPDTITDTDCLNNLIKKADKKTVLQPLLLLNIDGKNTDLINTTGNYLNFLGISYCNDYKKNANQVSEKDITTASGAAAFIPIEMFKKIGFFDKNFFMYHEDVDLFWRARLFGFNIRLVPDAKVWHFYSFSTNKNKFFFVERNRLIFIFKNFSIKYILLITPILFVNEILMISYSIVGLWLPQKISSYLSFFKLLPQIINSRKMIQSRSVVKETNLKKKLMPSISFAEIKSPLFAPYNLILRLYWRLIYPLV